MTLTKQQRAAVHRVWQRAPDIEGRRDNGNGPETYMAFRRRHVHAAGFCGLPNVVIIDWRGMDLGIEPDGYTHS